MLIFNDVKEPEEKISTVEILRAGSWVYGGRRVVFTEEDLQHIVENFKKGIRPKPPTELVVDYNHGSLDTEPEKSKAAGWVKNLWTEGGSLWAKIKWTPTAVNYIKNDEFRYVSAEIDPDYKLKESGDSAGITLLAVALTNRPFIEGQDSISLTEREDLHKKAEARAKKYHIHVRDDGHLTIPSEYSDCPESDFADPVNYMYPCNTPERAMAAYKYFSKEKNRSYYSADEIKIIEARIKKHLPKDIRENAFKGGEMDDKEILKLTEDLKAKEQAIVKLTEENKNLKEELAKMKKNLLMSEAHEWVMKMVNEKYLFAKEKDMFTEMYIKDPEFAKKFVETRGKVMPDGLIGESNDDNNETFSEFKKISDYADAHKITFAEARAELARKAELEAQIGGK